MSNISDYIEVTKEDISYAENILFGKTGVFDNDERIPIIKDVNESSDVNACPGSGKTTVAQLIYDIFYLGNPEIKKNLFSY